MDVWTLGMILLHCLCLEYRRGEGENEADKNVDTVEEILSLYLKVKGPSLINLEEDAAEAAAAIAEAEQKDKDAGDDALNDTSSQQSNHFEEIVETPAKKNWMNFYASKDEQDSQLKRFLTLKVFEPGNYSAKFVDFVKECLVFDPKDRLKPFDLLSHPCFRKYNKIYASQQLVLAHPITQVEKHHLQKLRAANRAGSKDDYTAAELVNF